MRMRNFWVSAEIAGRKSALQGGPRAKNGAMFVTVKVPGVHGRPHDLVELACKPSVAEDGVLHVTIRLSDIAGQIKETLVRYDTNLGKVTIED